MADREELRKQRAAALQRKREQSEQEQAKDQEALNAQSGGMTSVLKGGRVGKCFSSFTQGAFMGVLIGCAIGLGSKIVYRVPMKAAATVGMRTGLGFGALFGVAGLMRC